MPAGYPMNNYRYYQSQGGFRLPKPFQTNENAGQSQGQNYGAFFGQTGAGRNARQTQPRDFNQNQNYNPFQQNPYQAQAQPQTQGMLQSEPPYPQQNQPQAMQQAPLPNQGVQAGQQPGFQHGQPSPLPQYPNQAQPQPRGAGQQQRQGQQGQQRLATLEEMGITFEPIESLFGGAPPPPPEKRGQSFTDIKPQGRPFASNNDSPAQKTGYDSRSKKNMSLPVEDIKTSLRGFAQNERNGAMFYTHLAALAPDDEVKQLLIDITETCRKHNTSFSNIHKQYCNEECSVKDTQIDTRRDFRSGIKWALAEESKALRELAGLYERQELEGYSRELSVIMNRKIGDLGILIGLM